MMFFIMTELSVTESYIVRIYRYDTEDSGKVVGMIGLLDGRGTGKFFSDMDELVEALKSLLKGHKRAKKNKSLS